MAAGWAKLDGFTLRQAKLRAKIPKGEELPLTLEGVSVGDAYGEVEVAANTSADGRTIRVNVAIPKFRLDLPETAKHKVQGLDDDPRVFAGVYLGRKQFVSLPLQPLEKEEEEPPSGPQQRLLVVVELGRDVWVRRGAQLRVQLRGRLNAEILDEPKVTGQIQLARGKLDVQGKQFDIDNGTVTFQPDDPANPIVVASAHWDSPDGYRVQADFVGPVKTGNLTLRSEPALQENEILSLLLFGSPDGQFGASTNSDDSSTAATAVSVGGGAATKGLNRALSDLTSVDVQTRVDTSSGSPQPEVAIQVSRRLTAELGYNVGDPGPGQPPDRTFLTLDFRVKQNWSVSSTVGDRGSTLWDVLWRYRY
jgi:translocation and assembly module TamB